MYSHHKERPCMLEVIPQVLIEKIIALIENPIFLALTCKAFKDLLSEPDTKKKWLLSRGRKLVDVYRDISCYKFTDECKFICWNHLNFIDILQDKYEAAQAIFGNKVPGLYDCDKETCLVYLPTKKMLTYIEYHHIRYNSISKPLNVLTRILKDYSRKGTSQETKELLAKFLFNERKTYPHHKEILRDFLLLHQHYLVEYPWTVNIFELVELKKMTIPTLDSILKYCDCFKFGYNTYISRELETSEEGLEIILNNCNSYKQHFVYALRWYTYQTLEKRVAFLSTNELAQKFSEAVSDVYSYTSIPAIHIKIFMEALSYTNYTIYVSNPESVEILKRNSNSYFKYEWNDSIIFITSVREL